MKRFYTDTNFWIYYFEDHPKYGKVIEQFLLNCNKEGNRLITSFFSLAECLIHPIRENNKRLRMSYIEGLITLKNLELMPVEIMVSIRAAEIRAKYNLPTPDCIHLATADLQECDYFITNDRRLKSLGTTNMISVSELENIKL